MFQVILSGLVALIILIIINNLSYKKIIRGELSRKIPHMVVSIMVASWPLFISMYAISLLSLIFIAVTWIILKLNLFPHAREIERLSHGEYFLMAGFGIAALLDPSGWIFAAAILTVGLADSAAALVGTKHGIHKIKMFGHKKSLEGSLAFILVSVLILTTFFVITPLNMQYAFLIILTLPLVTALIEFVSPYGVDNLLVPTVIVLALMSSQMI